MLEITDAELDEWQRRGVGGFSCSTRHLRGLGGTQDYSGDPANPLTGDQYERQRRIRSSRIVERLHARGMKIYFGSWVADYHLPVTPYGDWFDDARWRETVLPKLRDMAAMAKLEGFDGLTLDQEDYPGDDGRRHSWAWNYPENTHTEADVRAKARQRGSEVMTALAGGYPDVTINVYHWNFPGSWQELVQHEVNDAPADNASKDVFLEFWDGMTRVEGYGRINFLDATFYKTTHLKASWGTALQYNANRLYASFSRTWAGWPYAASRVGILPFAWIDHDDKQWPHRAQSADEVRDQLAAFRVWGMGGEFFNFAYNIPMSSYDYSPYVPAMQAAAQPGVVDSRAPTLTIDSPPTRSADRISLSGSAVDDLAVRSVSWQTETGDSGQAQMTWVATSGDPRQGYDWRMTWQAAIPAKAGVERVTITVEDIKGLRTVRTIRIDGST